MNVRRKSIFHKALSVILALAMILGNMVTGNLAILEAAEEHNYVNGICTDTDCTQPYQAPEGDGSEENPYLIGNAGQLYYFAGIVNGDDKICTGAEDAPMRDCYAYGQLTADITVNQGVVTAGSVNAIPWTPIGSNTGSYNGVFDGKNHTISGLYCKQRSESDIVYVGLFGFCSSSVVQNVGVVNSYFQATSETQTTYAGGICGCAYDLRVKNCYVNASIEADSTAGGIVGDYNSNAMSTSIVNCYVSGTVDGNCSGAIAGWSNADYIINCYYLDTIGAGFGTNNSGIATATAKTAEEFAGGEVAWRLNKESGQQIFGQTLSGEGVSVESVQPYPVFGGKQVCVQGNAVCPGSEVEDAVYFNGIEDAITYEYANHNCDGEAKNPYLCLECNQIAEHDCLYVNGICKYCEEYQAPKGDGSIENPYEIGNAGQLYYFAGIINGNYKVCNNGVEQNVLACAKLTEDIILNEGIVNGVNDSLIEWTPLGNGDWYEGTIDGQGHVISGLYINEPNSNYIGFISNNDGEIKNLGIVNSYIGGDGYIGSIAAYNDSTTIENCYSTAIIVGTTGRYTGGLLGYCYPGTTVKNSYFAGVCTSSMECSPTGYGGGITGYEYNEETGQCSINADIQNCYFVSGDAVSGDSDGVKARTTAQFASGQVAYELNDDQSEITWGQTLSGEAVSAEALQSLPVLSGKQVCIRGNAMCPDSEVTNVVYYNGTENHIEYQHPDHEFTGVICKHCGYVKAEKPEGDGTKESPYRIKTAEELYYFAAIVNGDTMVCTGEEGAPQQNTGAYAVLTADIVLNQGTVTGVNDKLTAWTPVGKDADNSYTGIFDGKNYTISGLYINSTDIYGGLFGCLDGTIQNLGVENSYIKGSMETGSISGYANSNAGIFNCYSTAKVEADILVGGLVGNCYGVIENSYFAGVCLEGTENQVPGGGICGKDTAGTYTNCYVLSGSAVTADRDGVELRTAAQFASGQVAYELNGDQSEIIWGQILSGEGVSAEMIENLPSLGGSQVYEQTWKPCPGVEDTNPVVIAGYGYTNDEEDRYILEHENHDYDTDNNGEDDVYVCKWCKTVKEHQCEYENDICKYCGAHVPPKGDGSKEHPYEIAHESQLRWFADLLEEAYNNGEVCTANAVLVADIYLNPKDVTIGSVDAKQWDMISCYPEDATFDGQGHIIYGLFYEGNDDFGFVGENEGTICNVTFAGVSVDISCDDEYDSPEYGTVCLHNGGIISGVVVSGQAVVENSDDAAGICAENYGDVRNCVNEVSITGYEDVGGICGYNEGDIDNCINHADMNSSIDIGGICGTSEEGEMENCINYGDIKGSGDDVAGICGYSMDTKLLDCINYGNIEGGEDDAGGICGDSKACVFENCINYGVVDVDEDDIGGICGESSDNTFRNCINYGEVQSDEADVGGITGDSEGDSIENCINRGSIDSYDDAGGISGDGYETDIVNCANYGDINCFNSAGGICGCAEDVNITQCYNNGEIIADDCNAGGIAGYIYENCSIQYCYSTGSIAAGQECVHNYAGGIIGYMQESCSIEHCYYLDDSIGTGAGFYCTDCDAYDSITEEYEEEDGINAKSEDAFSGGEIAWLLNDALGETWLYQTLTGDEVQTVPETSGEVVNRKAYFGCSEAKEPISDEYFNGGEDGITYKYKVHNYDSDTLSCTECGKVLPHICIWGDDGYCKICYEIKAPEGKGTDEEPYKISNVAELYWFAGVVNGDKDICKDGLEKNVKACAVLTNDIVINQETLSAETTGAAVWTPMGMVPENQWDALLGENSYKGTFDGQGYAIRGIYIPINKKDSNGFFGVVGKEGIIKNLNLEQVYMTGGAYAGGICNYLYGTIEGCSVSGSIASKYLAGGIASGVDNSGVVYGCHNMAQIEAENPGGITSIILDGTVVGCYHTGEVTKITSGTSVTVENVIVGDIEENYGYVEGCYAPSEEDLASGMTAWKMNCALMEAGFMAGYGQILTGDKAQQYPVWNESTTVYAIGTASCPGVEVVDAEAFSNDEGKVEYDYENHFYEQNSYFCSFCSKVKEHECEYEEGYCKHCSFMKAPQGNGTEENPYQISNVAELYWFRDKVSGDLTGETADTKACAVLTNDINIPAYDVSTGAITMEWTPIGVSEDTGIVREYNGFFDGQGHIISGVAVETEESEGQYIGFFGKIGKDGVVTNLHIKDSYQYLDCESCADTLSDDERYLGGFCKTNAGIISGCSIDVEFNVENEYIWYHVAGFAGLNTGTIINSIVYGDVDCADTYSYNYFAGFCGVNEGTLKGCCNEADVDGYYETAGICYKNTGNIEECYSDDDVYAEDDKAAGICCYNEGTIKGCRNSDSVESYNSYAAGICYDNEGAIINCWNEADVYSEYYGVAGVCYENYGTVDRCWNEGEVYSYDYYACGISRYNYGVLTNCYNVGDIYSDHCDTVGICYYNYGEMAYCYHAGWADYALFYENGADGTVSYCYSDDSCYDYDKYGYSSGANYEVDSKNREDFASGSVAYRFNLAQGEPVFGQTLYCEDASGTAIVSSEAVQNYPVIGGKTVYPQGLASCPDAFNQPDNIDVTGYTNTPGLVEYDYPDHCYDADEDEADDRISCIFCGHLKEHTCTYKNGICSLCGWYEAPEGDGSKENPYTISNVGQLFYFAHVIEGISMGNERVTGNAKACAVLVDDIDMDQALDAAGEAIAWSAIGTKNGTTYEGIFDGNGYEIDGLYVNDTVAGLFAKTGKLAVVKNLTLSNCSLYGAQSAGITVVNEGTIENCSVDGWIEACEVILDPEQAASDDEYKAMSEQLLSLKKLYGSQFDFSGDSSSGYLAGGICSVNEGTMKSNWVNGSVISIDKAGFICADNSGKVSNGYYYKDMDDQAKDYITREELVVGKGIDNLDKKGVTQAVTSSDIESGKAAWMLDTDNKYEGNKNLWKMDADTSMPTLATEGAVILYYLELTSLDGSVQEYYVPANAELSNYLVNTEGAKWVYNGGTAGQSDGTDYTGTVMNVEVLILREVEVPIVTPEPSTSPEPGPTGSPNPSNSPNPGPTVSPEPDISERPSNSPDPGPTGSPNPSNSPNPGPTVSPEPDTSESPSTSPEPSPSTSVEPNPGPTGSPEPTDTPEPGPSPMPGDNVIKGDVNLDKVITLADAQMTLKAALKIIELDEKQKKAADVDGKTGIALTDAQLILKHALKIIDKFD